MKYIFATALALSAVGTPTLAQVSHTNGVNISDSDTASADLFVEDVSVLDGQVCIGNGCSDNLVFDPNITVLLKSAKPMITFEDTSTTPGTPSQDWQIRANDPGSAGENRFSVKDITADTIPFTIEANTPDNTLYVDSAGKIGIGTMLPGTNMHIIDGHVPALTLEGLGTTGLPPQKWDITNAYYLDFQDRTFGTRPVRIHPNAPDDSFVLRHGGLLGLGTSIPSSAFHLQRSDGTAKILVEETGASGAQELFQMKSNGGSYFTLTNTTSGRDWFFTHENNVGGRFIITSSTNPADGLFLAPDGDMTIGGTLTTGGGTCGGGCDAVFGDGYTLPSITEHAEAMWSLGHLPNVGPTVENAPINVSDKLGRMLNELEHAHIYIDQLHGEIAGLKTAQTEKDALRDTQINALMARLEILEASQ